MSKQAFTPDLRNTGGRDAVIERLNSHQSALLRAKPTMNTRVKPHPHVNAPKRKKGQYYPTATKHVDDYGEVREAFRRVSVVKKGLDNGKPKTFKMSKKLSQNRNRKPNFEQTEHMNNLASLQRRLGNLGSWSQRKKNPNDPIANPTYIFRR
eukprot:CAMPEP_0114992962 /NCGR_PEP_ID=MMETSP0216-20121206/12250_1 /TAXON_ID=223996 /ORGANISM="Protocruzia adherens, Strain Boccale" /LENGTH=151 /DNA_ID=CAMNT_0002356521 /DNA_START=29 /DNA_END=481 /DNA_ORIENTATION=+